MPKTQTETPKRPPPAIPWSLWIEVYRTLGRHWWDLLRLGAVPFAIALTIGIAASWLAYDPEPAFSPLTPLWSPRALGHLELSTTQMVADLFAGGVQWLAVAVFAVAIHRFLLIDNHVPYKALSLNGKVLASYLFLFVPTFVCFSLIYILVGYLPFRRYIVIVFLHFDIFNGRHMYYVEFAWYSVNFILSWFVLFFLLRIALALPSIALGTYPGIAWILVNSWRQTRRSGWRLLFVFLMVYYFLVIVFGIISGVSGEIFMEDQGYSIQFVPFMWFRGLRFVFDFSYGAIIAITLSLFFMRLDPTYRQERLARVFD